VHVDAGLSQTQAAHIVRVAQTLCTFWNTGDRTYLQQALDPSFRDNTLPAGRTQGPTGPAQASAGFRAAVPDLTCELADQYVTGDTLTARPVFHGHFTGVCNGAHGIGQVGTPRILDLLDKHDIKVTSFMIGDAVRRHPDVAAEIVRRGHEADAHGRSWQRQYQLAWPQ
jgi:hypothetical protein